jgi:hypothetical protein
MKKKKKSRLTRQIKNNSRLTRQTMLTYYTQNPCYESLITE